MFNFCAHDSFHNLLNSKAEKQKGAKEKTGQESSYHINYIHYPHCLNCRALYKKTGVVIRIYAGMEISFPGNQPYDYGLNCFGKPCYEKRQETVKFNKLIIFNINILRKKQVSIIEFQ